MRDQVRRARQLQRQRFGPDSPRLNSRMTSRQLRRFCPLTDQCRSLLKSAMDELGLSARAHDRILRMARTIADLENSPDIQPQHVVEAIGYRSLDRKLWAR
jgi:magnesium chelatase family protein